MDCCSQSVSIWNVESAYNIKNKRRWRQIYELIWGLSWGILFEPYFKHNSSNDVVFQATYVKQSIDWTYDDLNTLGEDGKIKFIGDKKVLYLWVLCGQQQATHGIYVVYIILGIQVYNLIYDKDIALLILLHLV